MRLNALETTNTSNHSITILKNQSIFKRFIHKFAKITASEAPIAKPSN